MNKKFAVFLHGLKLIIHWRGFISRWLESINSSENLVKSATIWCVIYTNACRQ